MKADNDDDLALHTRQVQAVTAAVAKLPAVLRDSHGRDFDPEAVFEGAVKGAAVQLIALRGVGAEVVAELLEDLARAFREEGAMIDGRAN